MLKIEGKEVKKEEDDEEEEGLQISKIILEGAENNIIQSQARQNIKTRPEFDVVNWISPIFYRPSRKL